MICHPRLSKQAKHISFDVNIDSLIKWGFFPLSYGDALACSAITYVLLTRVPILRGRISSWISSPDFGLGFQVRISIEFNLCTASCFLHEASLIVKSEVFSTSIKHPKKGGEWTHLISSLATVYFSTLQTDSRKFDSESSMARILFKELERKRIYRIRDTEKGFRILSFDFCFRISFLRLY